MVSVASLVVALAWGGVAFVVAAHRPRVARLPGEGVPRSIGPAERLGRSLRALARRPSSPPDDRWVGRGAIGAVAAGSIAPVLGLVVAFAIWAQHTLERGRRGRRQRQRALGELPELVDLIRVAVSAGWSPVDATRVAAAASGGPAARELAVAVAHIDRGARVAAAFVEAGRRQPELVGLARVLAAADRHGVPLEAGLADLSLALRRRRRRQVEAAARQVTVRLLFPLVLAVLPAFVLLTLVPTFGNSFGRLAL